MIFVNFDGSQLFEKNYMSISSPHIDAWIRTKIDFQKIFLSMLHYSENTNSSNKDPKIEVLGLVKMIFANFEGKQLDKKT